MPSSQLGRASTTSATLSSLPVTASTRPTRSVDLALVAAGHAGGHQRQPGRPGVPAGLPPGVLQPLAPLRQLLQGDAGGVVLVGPAGGQGQALGPGSPADQQGRARLLHRLGQGAQVLELVVAALEGEGVLGEGAGDDLQLLGQPLHADGRGRELEAVGAVLALVPAGPEPQLDPAAGDVVGRDHHLGQDRRVPEGGRGDQRAQADAAGPGGQRGQGGPGVERPALGIAHQRPVVVGAEQALQAVLLARPGQGEPLLPGDVLLALDHQADPHAALLLGCASQRTVRCLPCRGHTGTGSSSSTRPSATRRAGRCCSSRGSGRSSSPWRTGSARSWPRAGSWSSATTTATPGCRPGSTTPGRSTWPRSGAATTRRSPTPSRTWPTTPSRCWTRPGSRPRTWPASRSGA